MGEKKTLEKLSNLETRLIELEQKVLGLTPTDKKKEYYQNYKEENTHIDSSKSKESEIHPPRPDKEITKSSSTVTNILGWGGAIAIILAASYLVGLAIDNGWLTPERQILASFMLGLSLIGSGFYLKKSNPSYAGLLPAAGIVVLFISTYGAHFYYSLIGVYLAGISISFTCLVALWLCKEFKSHMYALLSVIGSYSAPFLLQNLEAEITDIAIYYTFWNILFCFFANWLGSRKVYLFALYLSLIGFDITRVQLDSDPWQVGLIFQTCQFIIFLFCTAYFSIKHKEPMDRNTALAHAPALLIFYFLQFSLLNVNLESYAPWISLISALIILLVFLLARNLLKQNTEGSRWLVSFYLALVLIHAGYFELVPMQWKIWVPILMILALFLYGKSRGGLKKSDLPLSIAFGSVFVLNYLRVLLLDPLSEGSLAIGMPETVIGESFLALSYSVILYVAYYLNSYRETDNKDRHHSSQLFLIYGAHIAALATAVDILEGTFVVSIVWAILAIASLLIGIKIKDKLLGNSALLIFAVSSGKVLLYDLSDSATLIRIGCLLVLGIALYAGGWLYKKINELETT